MRFIYSYVLATICALVFCYCPALASEEEIKTCLKLHHDAYITSRAEQKDQNLKAVKQYAPDIYDYSVAIFKKDLLLFQSIQKAINEIIDYHYEWFEEKDPATWALFLYDPEVKLSPKITTQVPKTEQEAYNLQKETGFSDPHIIQLMQNEELAQTYRMLQIRAIEEAGKDGFFQIRSKYNFISSIDCFSNLDSSLNQLNSLGPQMFSSHTNGSLSLNHTQKVNSTKETAISREVQPSYPAKKTPRQVNEPEIDTPSTNNPYYIPHDPQKKQRDNGNPKPPASRYILLPQ